MTEISNTCQFTLIKEALQESGLESLSWQTHHLDALLSKLDNLPHAILIDGSEGVGKVHAAQHVIYHWLLSGSDQTKIGDMVGKQFADLHVITTPYHFHHKLPNWFKNHALSYLTEAQLSAKKPSQIITIDQVRQFSQNIQLHALNSDYKIGLIYPVDRLNTYAANALLKTLEEPAGDTKMILCADKIGNVPETIRSRCMRVSLSAPTSKQASEWLHTQFINIDQASIALILKLVHNAPLKAKEMIESNVHEVLTEFIDDLALLIDNKKNPMVIASQWIKVMNSDNMGVSLIYQWLSVLFFDVYRQGVAKSYQELEKLESSDDDENLLEDNLDYAHIVNSMISRYKLANKEVAYESYRQLYLNAQNGHRLTKTATDQTLYLEQLLIKLYKLVL